MGIEPLTRFDNVYDICVIDIGSPNKGNLGWCFIDVQNDQEYACSNLDDMFPYIINSTKHKGLILGFEAPLFIPVRQDLKLATKARKGEGGKPWSAGAGAQVLTINLPIMIYIFKRMNSFLPNISYYLNGSGFTAKPMEIMLFEAFVSGVDKGSSHINDAQLMARSCVHYSKRHMLPPSESQHEEHTEFFNLAAAALLRCGLNTSTSDLNLDTPIYKPMAKM